VGSEGCASGRIRCTGPRPCLWRLDSELAPTRQGGNAHRPRREAPRPERFNTDPPLAARGSPRGPRTVRSVPRRKASDRPGGQASPVTRNRLHAGAEAPGRRPQGADEPRIDNETSSLVVRGRRPCDRRIARATLATGTGSGTEVSSLTVNPGRSWGRGVEDILGQLYRAAERPPGAAGVRQFGEKGTSWHEPAGSCHERFGVRGLQRCTPWHAFHTSASPAGEASAHVRPTCGSGTPQRSAERKAKTFRRTSPPRRLRPPRITPCQRGGAARAPPLDAARICGFVLTAAA